MPDMTDAFEAMEVEQLLSIRNVEPASFQKMHMYKQDAVKSLTRFEKIHDFTSGTSPAVSIFLFFTSAAFLYAALNVEVKNANVFFVPFALFLTFFLISVGRILFEEFLYDKAYDKALEDNLESALNSSFGEISVKDFLSFQYVMQKVDPVDSSYPNSSKFYELYLTGEKHETFSALSENFDGSLKELYETVEILAASN